MSPNSNKDTDVALKALKAHLKLFWGLPHDKAQDLLLSSFKEIFDRRITEEIMHRSLEAIRERHSKCIVHLNELPESVMIEVYRNEAYYLINLRSKNKAPYIVINLLSRNLLESMEGRRFLPGISEKTKNSSEFRELSLKLNSFLNINFEVFNKEGGYHLMVTDLERIIGNPIYDLGLRKLLFHYEGHRLKKKLEMYYITGLDKILNLNKEEITLICQYFFLCKWFKIRESMQLIVYNPDGKMKCKPSAFPPKRTPILQTILAYQKGRGSLQSIDGKIRKIFYPDYK